MQVIEKGEGELVVARRGTTEQKAYSYVPCEHCLAFFHVDTLWHHAKTCTFKVATDPDTDYLRNGRTLISPFVNVNTASTEVKHVLGGMKETKKNPGLVDVCENDILILQFIQSKCERLGTKEEQRRRDVDNIRCKARTLARLLKKLNDGVIWKGYIDWIHPGFFRKVLRTVKDLYKEANSPQLGLVLGHYIKQLYLLKKSYALQEGNEPMAKEADDFKSMYKAHWNDECSAVAKRTQNLRYINKTVQLPRADDLVKLTRYVKQQIDMYVSGKKVLVWTRLAKLLIVRILVFNKRRVSEVEEMLISDFQKRETNNVNDSTEILHSLDTTERALAGRFVNRLNSNQIRKQYRQT